MALRENTLHVFRICKERINFVQYICCLSNLSCKASDSTSPSDLPSEAVLIICMSCLVYPSKSSHILVYPSVYPCFKTLSLPGRFPLIVSFESKTTNPPKRHSYIAAWILSILVAADLICANKIGKISCQAALKQYTGHCRQPRYLQIVSGAHSPSKSRPTSINQFTIHSLSIRILCHCPSLSIIVLFIPFHSYFKDSFLPIGNLLAKGKPPALGNFGTSCEVDAPEPSHSILSGSSDRVLEAIGLTREGLWLGSWYLERSTGVAWMWVAQESGAKIRKLDIVWLTHTHTQCPWRIPQITFPTVVCKHNCWWCI